MDTREPDISSLAEEINKIGEEAAKDPRVAAEMCSLDAPVSMMSGMEESIEMMMSDNLKKEIDDMLAASGEDWWSVYLDEMHMESEIDSAVATLMSYNIGHDSPVFMVISKNMPAKTWHRLENSLSMTIGKSVNSGTQKIEDEHPQLSVSDIRDVIEGCFKKMDFRVSMIKSPSEVEKACDALEVKQSKNPALGFYFMDKNLDGWKEEDLLSHLDKLASSHNVRWSVMVMPDHTEISM